MDKVFEKQTMNLENSIFELTEKRVRLHNNFFNTFHDKSGFNYQCTFNPLDRYVEAMEKNKKLYERLLESEKEKVKILKEK